MTSPNGNGPRHLHDMTSEMPALGGRHFRPDTSELRAQRPRPPYPPMPTRQPHERHHGEPVVRPTARQERKRPWWKFWAKR